MPSKKIIKTSNDVESSSRIVDTSCEQSSSLYSQMNDDLIFVESPVDRPLPSTVLVSEASASNEAISSEVSKQLLS